MDKLVGYKYQKTKKHNIETIFFCEIETFILYYIATTASGGAASKKLKIIWRKKTQQHNKHKSK